MVFQQRNEIGKIWIERARIMIKDFTKQMKIKRSQTYNESSMHNENWKSPPTSFVKLNTDAGYKNNRTTGLEL